MDLPVSSFDPAAEIDTSSYSRWQDIFRSWFWRYYDNIFQLFFYNLGWFISCFAIAWLAGHWGLFSDKKSLNWVVLYIVFVFESIVSIPWALAVFKVFMEGIVSWADFKKDLRYYFTKALVSIALSGFVLALALFNLKFYFSFQISTHILILVLMGFVLTILVYGVMMILYQWPILFFQDPSLGKLFYRSFVITLGSGPTSLLLLLFSALSVIFFIVEPFLWFVIGFVFLFSLYIVALEKHLLRYKITYRNSAIADYIESMDAERKRGWRDILKPWETR